MIIMPETLLKQRYEETAPYVCSYATHVSYVWLASIACMKCGCVPFHTSNPLLLTRYGPVTATPPPPHPYFIPKLRIHNTGLFFYPPIARAPPNPPVYLSPYLCISSWLPCVAYYRGGSACENLCLIVFRDNREGRKTREVAGAQFWTLWRERREKWPGHNFVHRAYTVIHFLWVSAKFGTCTVVSINGTLVDTKMFTFTLESTHFIFN